MEVLTDVDGRFLAGEVLEAVGVDGRRRMVEILGSRSHRGQLLVRFRGIDDRDAAAEMRGASLEIAAHKSPDAPAGWYYYHQLVGCSCRDAEGGPLGVVDDVVEDGGGLLLSLLHGGQIILVPFVDEYIREIDLEKGAIDLVLPRGLLELCVSPS